MTNMRELEIAILQAQAEIRELRKHNDVLQARVDTFEKCWLMVAANLPPQPPVSMGEDVVWRLDRELEKIRRDTTPPTPEPHNAADHPVPSGRRG